MQDIDVNVIMIGVFFLAFLLLVIIFGVVYLFSSSRQLTKARVSRLRQRFGGKKAGKGEIQSAFAEPAKGGAFENFAQGLPNISEIKKRLTKTGRKITLMHYGGMIFVAGFVSFLFFVFFFGVSPILSIFLGAIIGLGLPHLVINAMIKARINKFISLFPDALDLIVRGLRSGLPITESMGSVANEIEDPVGGEFRKIMDQVRIGKTIDEALERTVTRIDTSEFKFFMISLSIQRETGGNLAETLAKLSDLLRRRRQMRLKIKAMASEGKASAYIVSALPFVMFIMLLMLNYEYTSVLFTDPRAIYTSLGGLVWMSIGAFIMKQMISFEI